MKTAVAILLCYALAVKASPRIVGGKDALPFDYPYQASVQFGDEHICGGSILNQRWILTSAHCLSGKNNYYLSVVVGTNKFGSSTQKRIGSNTYITHENYNSSFFLNDIGLVQVQSKIEFNNYTFPIQIDLLNNTNIGVKANLSGWGRIWPGGAIPDNLQETEQTITDNKVCEEYFQFPLSSSQFCTLPGSGLSACTGDDGGPLVTKRSQIGISSAVSCALGTPEIYTKVYSFRKWIADKTST